MLGAFLFAVALPKLIELELLPYEFYLISEDHGLMSENLVANQDETFQLIHSITNI